MNWAQFKDTVSHMCLSGAVVASWFQPFTVMTNILPVQAFRKKYNISLHFQYKITKSNEIYNTIPFSK